MIKIFINRAKRTVAAAVFHLVPVWHLTNLRREAYDQIEDLHYQVGYCRANRLQIEERLAEVELELVQANLTPDDKFTLEAERRQLTSRLTDAQALEVKAQEVVEI